MKIYTRTGDRGTTSLVDGSRSPKDSLRLESYGTVDELNSWLGLTLAAMNPDSEAAAMILWIQSRLFDLGAYLASPPATDDCPSPCPPPSAEHVARLESMIDRLSERVPPLQRFVIPGGSESAARAQVARTVARRAERRVISLAASEPVAPQTIAFLNRLSDLLFVLARFNNQTDRCKETFWEKDC